MTKSIPNYIRFLFIAISLILFYIIAVWVLDTFFNRSNQEGFGNQEYTYKPSKNDPNLSFKIATNDLAIDLSSACAFIKLDSQLKNTKPVQKPTSTTEPRGKDDTTTMTPSPYSEPESESTTATTTPTTATATPTETKRVEQFSTETESTTTSSETNLNSGDMDGDYTLPYTQLSIYKMFIENTGYSKTNNDSMYKKMDDIYGTFFDSSQLSKMTDANIETVWNKNKSIAIDDAIYNGVYYFAIQPNIKTRKCAYSSDQPIGLSSYFLTQIIQNKTRPGILLSLKNAYYAIVKPRFLMNALSNIYWKNAKSLTNSDKGTFNSVLFVLNTCGELGTASTLDADLSSNNVADITKDTTLSKDSLRIYQIMSVGFELYRFVAYFEKNGATTSGKGTPAITTTFTKFISGHPEYLKRTNQVEQQSPLVFIMRNPPNNGECPVVDKLAPFISNIES